MFFVSVSMASYTGVAGALPAENLARENATLVLVWLPSLQCGDHKKGFSKRLTATIN